MKGARRVAGVKHVVRRTANNTFQCSFRISGEQSGMPGDGLLPGQHAAIRCGRGETLWVERPLT